MVILELLRAVVGDTTRDLARERVRSQLLLLEAHPHHAEVRGVAAHDRHGWRGRARLLVPIVPMIGLLGRVGIDAGITRILFRPKRLASALASPYSKPPVGCANVPYQKPGSGIWAVATVRVSATRGVNVPPEPFPVLVQPVATKATRVAAASHASRASARLVVASMCAL
jgi:hypothetical protein